MEQQKIDLVFFKTYSDKEPVRDWLLGLDKEDRALIGYDLLKVQYGWPVGMPLCRSLKHGLWEVRSNITDGKIARVIFCFSDGELIALNGFIKKTQKTPNEEIELSLKRKKEYES